MTSLGRLVGNRYRLLHEIGRGGMGSVWVADHVELGSKVAIKVLDTRLANNEQARRRFRREARAVAALGGAYVARVFDYGIDQGAPYIAMELLEGETLATRLKRYGRLPIQEVRQVLQQVAKGLAKAHAQQIVHRDLKPANVFLVDDGAGFFVKVLDFGVAKVVNAESTSSELLTTPGQQLGTLHYMSPEQFSGDTIDERTDVWALGVLAFECLTGEVPFDGNSIPEVMAAICTKPLVRLSAITTLPRAFDAWQARALCRNLLERERSVVTLADRFEALTPNLTGRVALNPSYAHPQVTELAAFASTKSPRSEARRPSSIPAAIDGGRDLDEIGLVSSINRKSAVLWTRRRCVAGQAITLSLHFEEQQGYAAPAWVLEVNERSPERPELWHYEVEVVFQEPLQGLDSLLATYRAR